MKMNIVLGYDVLLILTHEIGHALGLLDSNVPTAVMYKELQIRNRKSGHFKLDDDDVLAIQVRSIREKNTNKLVSCV